MASEVSGAVDDVHTPIPVEVERAREWPYGVPFSYLEVACSVGWKEVGRVHCIWVFWVAVGEECAAIISDEERAVGECVCAACMVPVAMGDADEIDVCWGEAAFCKGFYAVLGGIYGKHGIGSSQHLLDLGWVGVPVTPDPEVE